MSHVLIVDDEESICWGLRRLLTEEGHEVTVAAGAEEALAAVERRRPDLALFDVRLPGIDGLTALERLRATNHDFPVIIVTAYGDLDTAVRAVERGAFDYLTKPFDLEHVVAVVRRAAEVVTRKFPPIPTRDKPVLDPEELVGRGPAMQEVFKRIALAAPTDAAVLLVGESGTGKELAARALHRHSRYSAGPFVPIHLGALNPSLVESELFGHARGAFTGADADRAGLLEAAEGGTVFLDEAADIPHPAQVKLLRVLQQREMTRVGETRARPCRFRVVAAVNRDPADCVREGNLRNDLLYRLAGFEIRLPPLRERREDVVLLAERFLDMSEASTSARGFSDATLRELRRRSWPGNVRELRNAVEQAAICARSGVIEPAHLPPPGAYEPAAGSHAPNDELRRAVARWAEAAANQSPDVRGLYDRMLDETEPPLFDVVLRRTLGNRAAAADLLGLHRATLRKKLAERRAGDDDTVSE